MDLREFVDRYGLALGVVLALAVVVAALPGNVDGAGSDLAAGGVPVDPVTGDPYPIGPTGGAAGPKVKGVTYARDGSVIGPAGGVTGSGGGPTVGGTVPGTGRPAAGPAVAWGKGPDCRPDGRQKGIAKYMPPCVQWLSTDNGGATARGVTRDKVLVVRYLPQLDPGTQAILEGANLADDPETIKRSYQAIFRYHNLHEQTYGREVVVVDYAASGPSENEEAMEADAVQIATKVKPFAVIEGNPAAPMPTVLIRKLAQLGVPCMCSTSLSAAFYNELPPTIFSSLPVIDEYAAHSAEYTAKRLAGRNASYAGDELNPTQGFRNKKRTFGLIFWEGERGKVDPEKRRWRDVMRAEFAKRGLKFTKEVGYIYDPGRNQQDVTNLVASLKSAGVTTIYTLWDPLYPILITREATNQNYFPEWFVVGTGLSDTTTAGRLYDQSQWRHAFGISPLWVTWSRVADSSGYREYHHGMPGEADGREGVLVNIYRARIQTLFRGIQMAGPRLTNETFTAGMFAFPSTGGLPALPLVFLTRQSPTEIKDFVEVYYDANARGPDERSEDGLGLMMKVLGGKRYRPGEWPRQPPYRQNPIAVGPQGDPRHEQDGHTHPAKQRCLSCR